jgi:hypothetical protein
MSSAAPPCRSITVVGFRGDQSRQFAAAVRSALHAEKHGLGPGPSPLDCLLFVGHAGVSTDGGTTIFGFNPNGAGMPLWEMMERLRNAAAFPGVARDDAAVFAAARSRGLKVLSFEVILPEPQFQGFEAALDAERRSSQYSYGFPDGDGDCNCVTWLERLGLPLLTGYMYEFAALPGMSPTPNGGSAVAFEEHYGHALLSARYVGGRVAP